MYNLPDMMTNLSQFVIAILISIIVKDVFIEMKMVSLGFLLYILSIGMLLYYVVLFIYDIVMARVRVK
ncbi:hypothetical protein BG74_00320 [Sodalis-like endosymbiont of Proechinophthirus fluctus]|nr:hypothetical protein BG74_00320 [Sodalis-like endosymbiont of Proechinophthirus fluctus]